MDRPRVLVADDDAEIRDLLGDLLGQWGYDVATVADGAEAVRLIQRQLFDAALLDIRMPELDGLQLLETIKRHDSAIEVVMMTGDPMVSTAVQALKAGAYDYLVKPLNYDELRHLLQQIVQKRFLAREVHTLRSRLGEQLAGRELIGASPQMVQLKELIATVAGTDSPVLIEGESGTGKELAAAALHRQSPRAKNPFVPVNCGAIPAELMESEFFGHVRGAFTGAVADTLGLFRAAEGGTLFLDEVTELPQALQAKLLRALQDREVRPVGSTRSHAVDVRVVAATNRNIEAAVRAGTFRQDLFYRINVVRLVMPPLRERRSDIPALVARFVRQFNERYHRSVQGVAPEAMALLTSYHYPGNVRELENLIDRAFALGARDEITLGLLPTLGAAPEPAPSPDEPERFPTVEDAEREVIVRALRRFGSDRERAARALGLSVRTFYRRLKKHRLL